MNQDELIFAQEDDLEYTNNSTENSWSVLIVDDDVEVHSVTRLALHDFKFEGKNLNLISAYSAKEAKEILNNKNDFAFILLDIVMETPTAGLDLVNYIRNELQNEIVRIIIRTGQPGFGPEEDLINDYDINDYKEKTELTSTKLFTTTRTALSQYKQLSELKNKQDEIYYSLITDSLTNLYSRDKLYKDLKEIENPSLILVDIDSFSTVNNAYGYSIGNKILKELASLLTQKVSTTSNIYRVDSDNFVLLFTNKEKNELLNIALNIKQFIKTHQFELKEIDLKLSINVSIGISHYPYENLLHKCEIAVNAARKKQDNKIEFYSENLKVIKDINNNILWSKRLARAIIKEKVHAYYQPIIDCKTDKIVKYEALVRLEYDDIIYSPNHFLEAARSAGLLSEITKIVVEQACQKFKGTSYDFAINITDHDLMNSDFTDFMRDCCKKYGIDTSRVSIEILEEESISKNTQAQTTLKELKHLGFQLSVDDFGVEYSNFSQLKSLDVDYVKIDGNFIKDIHTNQNSLFVTQAILSYTKNIQVKTIAEYVHNKEIYDVIKKLGIDYAQGFYFSEPLPDIEHE